MLLKHMFSLFFFSITLTDPGKVVITWQAVKVITTSQEYEFDIGELATH